MRCSHLDGHRRRPRIAFAVRPGRASAALLLWVPALSPRVPTFGKSPFSPREGFWCRRSTALSSSWVSNLGESTVKETNRSFDRSRSEFADPRYRPRGRITKSVTVTTAPIVRYSRGPQPPSFWFLNINMPVFLLKPFPNCLRKTWFKFVGGSPSKCWPNNMPVFVCIAIGKSGFLKKKSQNGRWPKLFAPEVCSVKPVLAEELKKSGCLCSKYLTSLLSHVYVNRLVWT